MEGKQKCDLIHGVGRPTFQKCFWPVWLGLNDQSEYNCLTVMCGLGQKQYMGTYLVVQWLTLCTPNAGGPGLILGQAEIPAFPGEEN